MYLKAKKKEIVEGIASKPAPIVKDGDLERCALCGATPVHDASEAHYSDCAYGQAAARAGR